jgi:RNA processing factor Prp31
MKVKVHKKKSSGAPAEITKDNILQYIESMAKVLDEQSGITNYLYGHPTELYPNTELKGRDVVKICARRMKELQNRHYPDEWIKKELEKIVEGL